MLKLGVATIFAILLVSQPESARAACGDSTDWNGAADCASAAARSYPGTGQGMAMEAIDTTIKNKILNDPDDKEQ